ncbi:MAG: hypothetical protein Q9207_002805 [Kuettlingeria erythrocarpa]
MSTVGTTMPSTTEALQEQVWDLKERLEDANAQNVLHLKQLQRLRTEIRSKDRELNGLKSSSAAALSLQMEAKNAIIAEFESRAWIHDKDNLVSQEAKALHAAFLNFFSITQIDKSSDLTLKKAQRQLNDDPIDHLPAPSATDSLLAEVVRGDADQHSLHDGGEKTRTHAPAPIPTGSKRTYDATRTLEGHNQRQQLANSIEQRGTSDEEAEYPQGKNPKRVAAGRKGGLRRAMNMKAAGGLAETDRQGNVQDGALGSGQIGG